MVILGNVSHVAHNSSTSSIINYLQAESRQNPVRIFQSVFVRMDTLWPQSILSCFVTIPPNPRENDYYPSYNKLLNVLFPVDGPFTIGPWSLPILESHKSINFLVEYQVFWGDALVFILEIKTGPKLDLVSAREQADLQICTCLRDLIGICPLSKLHVISAIGTKLCFYTAEAGNTITLPRIVADDQFVTDTAPLGRWDCDVLEAEGAACLKAIVHEIHQACTQLDCGECSHKSHTPLD